MHIDFPYKDLCSSVLEVFAAQQIAQFCRRIPAQWKTKQLEEFLSLGVSSESWQNMYISKESEYSSIKTNSKCISVACVGHF